jgi:hypothetical protein
MAVDNPPAFPRPRESGANWSSLGAPGMTLRDYFAGQALTGRISFCGLPPSPHAGVVAATCYEIADAMLAARGDA